MPRPTSLAVAALCALLAAAVLAPAAPASAAAEAAGISARQAPRASLLFVQETRGGQLERVRKGVFRLRLNGVSRRVSTFTDRPRRRAGRQSTRNFVRDWGSFGFRADPPNAALVVDGAPKARDVALLTLSRPRYNPRKRLLTYTGRPLRGKVAGGLAGFAKRRDALRPGSFGAASLFIDDGGSLVYQPVELRFTDVSPGQSVAVELSENGAEAGWALGPPFDNSAAVGLTTEFGPAPITALSVTPTRVQILTSPAAGGGGPVAFNVNLYLQAAEGISSFYLRSTSDPGVQVLASIGNTIPQPVSQTQTLFTWGPI